MYVTRDGVVLVIVNGTALLVTPLTTAVTLTAPAGKLGTCTAIEFTVHVVIVAAVEPNIILLLPWLAPKDAPTPAGKIVTELPATPDAGLTHAICKAGVALTIRETVVVAERVPDEPPVDTP